MKTSDILGLNARTQLFSYRYNKKRGKAIAASKLLTERILTEAGVPTPKILVKFKRPESIFKFDWQSLPSSFALKPSRGLGGEGIIVAKKRTKDKLGWITTSRSRVNPEDLKLHVLDIMEGAYSLHNRPDVAFIQEYVGRHKAFVKYAYQGTPDIRIIIFNKVPVMAMLRLPTRDSGGRANLHQGAVAVGVDIATGITTKALWYGEHIRYKPGTKRKLHGIKIPNWRKILRIAVEAQMISGLGLCGVDVMLDPEKGPTIVELNYQPGLQIQMANEAGLKKRMERVEDLKVRDPEHAVKIAKALFMADFADRVKADEGVKTVSAAEEILIKTADKSWKPVMAKLDTGAWRTSISENLANELGLMTPENVLWTKKVKSSLGSQERPVINLQFKLAGRKITTPASVAKRMALKYPVIIGRKNLKGLLVDPTIDPEKREKVKQMKEKER